MGAPLIPSFYLAWLLRYDLSKSSQAYSHSETNWPPIGFLGEEIGGYTIFQYPQYSDRRDVSFDLLSATAGTRASLLLCSLNPVENALQG